MKNIFLLTVATVFLTTPAMAGDTKLSCAEISGEMEELNAIITAAGGANTTNKVTQAGATAAVHGAIYSGAGSSVPFLGGIANVVGAVTSANAENAAKNAANAEKRIIKLETVAEMKGCS